MHPSAYAPEAPTYYTVTTAQQTTMPARAYTYLYGSAEVPTPTPHSSSPQTQEAENTPPSVPPAPVPRGLEETVVEDVARPLFVTRHGRANTLDT